MITISRPPNVGSAGVMPPLPYKLKMSTTQEIFAHYAPDAWREVDGIRLADHFGYRDNGTYRRRVNGIVDINFVH